MAEEKGKMDNKPEKKPDKEKKPSFLKRTSRSLKDMTGEIKKVVWPTKKQILNNTGIVIVFVVISGIAVGGLDFLLKLAVDFLLRTA